MIEWDSPDKFIGTAAAIASLAAAGASTAGGIIAARSQSSAARDAANSQVTAANHAADLQAKAAADALAFQESQAAKEQENFLNTERANYGQYSDRQNRIGQLGPMLGLPARSAPALPDYLNASPIGAGQTPAAASGGADPKVAAFIANWQQTHPVSEGIAPIADALKKAGLSSGRFDYGNGNLSNNEVTVGGKPYKVLGGEGTPAAYWYVPGTNDSAGARTAMRPAVQPISAMFTPTPSANLSPALMMPRANPFGV